MGRWVVFSPSSLERSSFFLHELFFCSRFAAGKTRNLRRSRDSPPASALYVHDRVSGCVRDWSNHPGLEICCGCIPPSDNVAMDHTSPLPLPNPGPARSDREPEWRDQPGKMKGRAQSFHVPKLSKFPQNKKAGPRRKQNACEGRCEARLRNRLTVAGRKKLKKNPPKNGSSPLAFDGALRESPPKKIKIYPRSNKKTGANIAFAMPLRKRTNLLSSIYKTTPFQTSCQ